MLKKILRILLKLLITFIILFLIIYACRDEVIENYISTILTERYFEGTGHSSEVVINKWDEHDNLTLDTFTNDAYDIRVGSRIRGSYQSYWDSSYYWLSFSYKTFSTNCKEDNESNIVLPYILNSPHWWPRELGETIIPAILRTNRSNYKFYRCRAEFNSRYYSYFEYFAIDNKTKKGYYWRTTRGSID